MNAARPPKEFDPSRSGARKHRLGITRECPQECPQSTGNVFSGQLTPCSPRSSSAPLTSCTSRLGSVSPSWHGGATSSGAKHERSFGHRGSVQALPALRLPAALSGRGEQVARRERGQALPGRDDLRLPLQALGYDRIELLPVPPGGRGRAAGAVDSPR